MTCGSSILSNIPIIRGKRFAPHRFRAVAASSALIMLCGAAPLMAQTCKPAFAIADTGFSEPRNQQRTWTARIDVDASRCAATSGPLEITFIRLKENAPDLQFTETFTWKPGRIEVSLDFWWDEAVFDQWIGNAAACACTK